VTIGMGAVVFVTALILPSLSLPAKAGFKIYNKTKETVDVAVAYVNRAGGFISEGWFTFRPCQPRDELISSSETSDPHHYITFITRRVGKAGNGQGSLSSARGQTPFKFKDAQHCSNWRGHLWPFSNSCRDSVSNWPALIALPRQCPDVCTLMPHFSGSGD
jgi:uncharacterized membrane protein